MWTKDSQHLTAINLLSLAFLQLGYSQTNYCSITPAHTMCLYGGKGPGPACGTSPNTSTDVVPQDTIVALHNQLRRRVAKGLETRGNPGPQPSASDMMEMTWDDELALIAQTHADQCLFTHDCNLCRSVPRGSVGQNLAFAFEWPGPATQNWTWAINDVWYNSEVPLFPNTSVNNPVTASTTSTSHYMQIVKSRVTRVGCGYRWYKQIINSQADIGMLYVCNYYVALITSEPLYTIGSPNGTCPTGSTRNNGLCSAV